MPEPVNNAGPIVEEGVIAGNYYDKYHAANPIARYLMNGFHRAVDELVSAAGVSDIHEVGCGEGRLSIHLAQGNRRVRASDFSRQVIDAARDNAGKAGVDIAFRAASIYELAPERDSAGLVVCCEVLEHLDDPERGMRILAELARPYLLVSVPREPIWRVLNMLRLKYVDSMGNTPGHIQHWSKRRFVDMLARHVDVVRVATPLPWTVALCRARR